MPSRYAKRVKSRWTDAVNDASWQDFETMFAAYYERQGYRVEHSGTGKGPYLTDGGIDLKLYRDAEYVVVQCKHWKALQVTHNSVHELIGVMHTQHATGAVFITSGEFTQAALKAAREFPSIELIDGTRVRTMIGVVPASASAADIDTTMLPSWMDDRARSRQRAMRARVAERTASRETIIKLALIGVIGAIGYIASSHTRETATRQSMEAAQHYVPPTTSRPSHVSAVATPVVERPLPRPSLADVPTRHAVSTVIRSDGSQVVAGASPENRASSEAWARQNAESMRILEKTTPELGNP